MSVNDWNGQGFFDRNSCIRVFNNNNQRALWRCLFLRTGVSLTLVCLGYGNASATLLWPLLLVQVLFRKAQQRQHPGEEVVFRKGECHNTTIEVSDSWESSDQSEQRHCETYHFGFVLPFHCKKHFFLL